MSYLLKRDTTMSKMMMQLLNEMKLNGIYIGICEMTK